jgi:hypothetical protein
MRALGGASRSSDIQGREQEYRRAPVVAAISTAVLVMCNQR